MSVSMKVSGFGDIEKALAQLPAGTAKGVARRAMKKELAPVKAAAEAFWPGATEALRVSSKVKRSQRPAIRECPRPRGDEPDAGDLDRWAVGPPKEVAERSYSSIRSTTASAYPSIRLV